MSTPARLVRLHAVLLGALLLACAVAAALSAVEMRWLTRLATAWEAGVALFVAVTLWRMRRAAGIDAIRQRAAELDQAGAAILPLSLLAALASVVVVVGEGASAGGRSPIAGGLVALAAAGLSWLFIHLIFALHYAHAFYGRGRGGGDRGGLIFPGERHPDYWDFLHFSLIIGVASQTADIQIADRGMRRLSSVHSLTAFAFNTVILALAVNLMVELLGKG